MKALVAAVKTGQFAHVLERARQDRDDTAQRAQAEADLAATGIRVIESPGRAARSSVSDGRSVTPGGTS